MQAPSQTYPGVTTGPAGVWLIPCLTGFTTLSPQAQALRAERRESQERRGGQPETADVAAGYAIPEHMAQARRAERELAPGSHAARQAQRLEVQQHSAQSQRQAFRQALTDAAGRENQPVPPPPSPAKSPASSSTAASIAPKAQAGAEPTTPSPAAPAKTPAQPTVARPAVDPAAAAPVQSPCVTTTARAAATVAPGGAPAAPAVQAVAAATIKVPASPPVAAATNVASARPAPQGGPTPAPPVAGAAQHSAPRGAAAVPGRSAPAATGKTDANTEQIVRVLRSQLSAQRSQATLRLDPPELGTLRLHLDLQQDALSLRIEPQTDVAFRLLSEQLEALRQALHAAGIQLEQVEIRPPATTAQSHDLAPHDFGPGQRDPSAADPHTDDAGDPGTEAQSAASTDTSGRDAFEPAAESLVNLWA